MANIPLCICTTTSLSIHLLMDIQVASMFSVQFSSVTQSCASLCDPVNHSTPGLPVHHQLLEFTQTHVHQSVMPSNHLILCCLLLLLPSIFPKTGSFQMSQLFASGGHVLAIVNSTAMNNEIHVSFFSILVSSSKPLVHFLMEFFHYFYYFIIFYYCNCILYILNTIPLSDI